MAAQIPVNDLEEGMVLAEPLLNSYGGTLLPAGSILKESHLRLLKTWDIHTVMIKDDVEEVDIEISKEQLRLAMEYLRSRMSWMPRNEIEKDMFSMAVLYTAQTKF